MSATSSGVAIEIADRYGRRAFEESRLEAAVRAILSDAGVRRGDISIAIVDDVQMHELNRTHLRHDYPTDVLSFLLHQDDQSLEGEIIVSADTAAAQAERLQWSVDDELLLYVVHGVLHLVGHDDHSDADRSKMRSAEQHYLHLLGVKPRYDD